MRSIGNVRLTMGLVSCPVQLMTAIDSHDRKASMFHYHEADNAYGKVKMPKVCEDCGVAVSQGDTAKGFEENGETVMLSADELETIAATSGGALEIPAFIRAKQVNPMMFSGEKAYYLVPDMDVKRGGKQALSIYMMIRKVLAEQDLVGVVQYTRWGRNRIALLRIEHTEYGGVLVLQNMMWPDELREPAFPVLMKALDADVDARLLPVGRQVIESMVEDWNPAAYHDTYMEALSAAIAAKAGGKAIALAAPEEAPAPDDIEALLAALEASNKGKAVKAAPAKKAAARKAPPRKKVA